MGHLTRRSMKQRMNLTEKDWYAIYLHLAGLIPSRSEYVQLRTVGHRISPLLPSGYLSRPMWKIAGQRPYHNPVRRLAGLAVFVKKFPGSHIYPVLHDLCYARSPYKVFKIQMSTLYQPQLSSEFKKMIIKTPARHLWGDDLLSEIIGNVIIPFFYYQAHKTASTGFKEYLESIYYQLPLNNQYSRISAFLKWPEIQGTSIQKFYLQQAFLHIRQNFCLNNLCQGCPLHRIAETR